MNLQWRHGIIPDRQLTPEQLAAAGAFRNRASEFLLNVDDLELPNVHTASIEWQQAGAGTEGRYYSNIWPGRFRAKGLFMDFRPMVLSKGSDARSNFRRVANIVRESTNDDVLLNFVRSLSKKFLSETLQLSNDTQLPLRSRQVSFEKVLNLWFNTYYFHSGNDDQVQRAIEIQSIFEAESIQQMLFFELIRLSHYVRCLYAILQDASDSNVSYSCPDELLVRPRS